MATANMLLHKITEVVNKVHVDYAPCNIGVTIVRLTALNMQCRIATYRNQTAQ